MFEHILYILLAVLGLGFLVFIHEFGHFWWARREGMAVEAFSIGFGRPIFTWMKDGVRWQIGWLPFGGYVRIAGMQKEGSLEPYEINNGFYSKRPIQRIRVALMGPLVNIAFAAIAFIVLWLSGGRDKSFSEFTHRIGWVDPKSVLYEQGVRPGDVIQSYDGRPFDGIKDLLIASIMRDDVNQITGYKIDYLTGQRSNFDYTLKTYENPALQKTKDRFLTIGVLTPAQYLIYENGGSRLQSGSPMFGSGIEQNDRLIWADGEMIFSLDQLKTLINESTVFLTVQRGDKIFQTKVPRVHFDDLKMTRVQRAEMDDWQHEAGIKGRLQDLYFIPYLLSPKASVEMRLSFIDAADQEKAFDRCQRCSYFNPLQEDDIILAVDGKTIDSSYSFLQQLQERRVMLIMQRDFAAIAKVLWKDADRQFEDSLNLQDLQSIVSTIGTSRPVSHAGNLILLNSVTPKPLMEVPVPADMQEQRDKQFALQKKEIESISDPEKKQQMINELEQRQRNFVLGLTFKDRVIIYNPGPVQLFVEILQDTWRTLSGLFSGSVNPKYMSGPIGIVQVIHQSWESGAKEALYWMALISMNLGIINLLPIPVLDGGHIFFSVYEAVTKRRISGKNMERMIIPFVGLLIAFFIYITFQDLSRIFSRFF
ncbi:MAG: yaeL [Parachlamydiales bacterium]|nr:yaeL [Parachlamydiales bacterium]